MPKQALKVGSFHNGLNSKADPRDIKDDELAVASNISVDSVGQITMSGNKSEITTTGLAGTTVGDTDGYGLFRFSSDYNKTGADTRTNYLIAWDDTSGKFYWLPGNTTWETNTSFLDLSSDWGTGDGVVPTYYYADGALRISDGNFGNTANPSIWIGNIKRNLFPGSANSSGIHSFSGWERTVQELETPGEGQVASTVPSDLSEIPDNGIRWRIYNLRGTTTQLYDFSDSSNAHGNEDMYFMEEPYTGGGTDESWQTVEKITDGYEDSSAHAFGFAFYEEDDDASYNWTWLTHGDIQFNTSNAVSFGTGQSLYLAARMTGEEQKQMWNGTHYRPESGDAFLSMSIDDATISFRNIYQTESIKFHIDHTMFTDSTTPSGEWHILEFPFDDNYENNVDGTINVQKMFLELSVSWTRKGDISNVSGRSGYLSGESFIELSDLRVGESELVGVKTVGKQKFSMSYTYDDKENESLLYKFGATESNTTNQEVVLPNSTSSYKIGIEAYIDRLDGASFNKRVTGANLYMEDEGIPYRVAELRYMKGLRGAWESEYPTVDQFEEFDTNGNKSSLIKTDGLPLLESYEAMNGFSPMTPTLAASYKTAVVQNRQAYIGNVYQDGKAYGDRMIKTVTNSFDVFPVEGREIDVVMNDGDDIIHLETYADRILQFKRNTMYLINATRSAEYLEDSFLGKGVAASSAVTKTDIGVAWANENGCYLYDGEKVNNLIDGLIDDIEWKTHITSTTDVTYHPLKGKILVTGGSSGLDLYEFTRYTRSWTKSTNKLDATKTNFVIDIDNEIKYVSSDVLYKWDDTATTSTDVVILTRDFDFNSPAARKKCFKFYVTYKSDGDTNIKVYHGINGLDLTGSALGVEVADSKFAGTNTDAYVTASNGLLSTGGEWKQAELKPVLSLNNIYSVQLKFSAVSTVPSSFAINDITIVYRQKPLK